MLATLANFGPFEFVVLDTVAVLVVLGFVVRGLILAVLGRPAWKTVLIATSCYVVWANALLGSGLTGFNPGGYLIIIANIGWDTATRGGQQHGEDVVARRAAAVAGVVGWDLAVAHACSRCDPAPRGAARLLDRTLPKTLHQRGCARREAYPA
jgi:hypothetical protein